ncbi:hypothetical protein PIB30_001540 [Stylosanthes scabra]|uniref:WRKY domain-containing protein n=1 Tax=Stylosanthes scabra TaxID=79078 RepID=A0ABU6R2N8_9FABA|nr:hypothetical protein [Stylosanthes scabra]
MNHEEDWDLFAIVRSCKAANNTAQTSQETSSSSNSFMSSSTNTCLATTEQNDGPFSSNNFAQPWTNGFQELNQLLNTFNPTITTTTTTTSAHGINPNPPFPHFTAPSTIGASTSGFDDRFHHHHQQQQQQKHHNQLQVQVPQTSTTALALLPSSESQIQTPRSRKRKSQQKKMVCQVTADNLSSDLWAWRKYGQKPIKGSPYPRNYYRCSSCKGCAARKQVERSLSDPTMFVVTYTGEHKHAKPAHRNSLAGSTRKPSTTTRLPEIQESTDNNNPDEKSQSSTTEKYQNAKPEVQTEIEQEMDESSSEDDSDGDDGGVLIPNTTATMSDAVFLGSSSRTAAAATWHYDGGFENSSDPDGSTNQI